MEGCATGKQARRIGTFNFFSLSQKESRLKKLLLVFLTDILPPAYEWIVVGGGEKVNTQHCEHYVGFKSFSGNRRVKPNHWRSDSRESESEVAESDSIQGSMD